MYLCAACDHKHFTGESVHNKFHETRLISDRIDYDLSELQERRTDTLR